MALTQVLGRVLPSGIRVPFYACRVSAGFPSPADDFAEAALSLDELTEIRAPSTYLVRAGGDSMIERGIYCGDVLVVNRALDAVSGDVVIASVGGEFTVKELSWRPARGPCWCRPIPSTRRSASTMAKSSICSAWQPIACIGCGADPCSHWWTARIFTSASSACSSRPCETALLSCSA